MPQSKVPPIGASTEQISAHGHMRGLSGTTHNCKPASQSKVPVPRAKFRRPGAKFRCPEQSSGVTEQKSSVRTDFPSVRARSLTRPPCANG